MTQQPMVGPLLDQARAAAAGLLTDTARLWRPGPGTVTEQGARARSWQLIDGHAACLAQAAETTEWQAAGGSRRVVRTVVKLPADSPAAAGDLVEVTSGRLAGQRWLLAADQDQSWAVLKRFEATAYQPGKDDSWSQ